MRQLNRAEVLIVWQKTHSGSKEPQSASHTKRLSSEPKIASTQHDFFTMETVLGGSYPFFAFPKRKNSTFQAKNGVLSRIIPRSPFFLITLPAQKKTTQLCLIWRFVTMPYLTSRKQEFLRFSHAICALHEDGAA